MGTGRLPWRRPAVAGPAEDPREIVPPYGATPFWTYLALVVLAGLAMFVAVLVPAAGDGTFDRVNAGYGVVAALLLLAELRPVVLPSLPDPAGLVTTGTFQFALLLEWGLGPALVALVASGIAVDAILGRAWWRIAFNIAQQALSWAAAGGVLALCGYGAGERLGGGDLPAVLAAGVVYFVVNDVLVAGAIGLHERRGVAEVARADLGYQATTCVALLALSPIVVVAAERGALFVPLLLAPLWAVHKAVEVWDQKEYQALHDPVTGLPNRTLLLRRLDAAILRARQGGGEVGLFLLDVERFKEINNTLGHLAGDQLMRQVADRLGGAVGTDDTVARLGGEEYAVLVPSLPPDGDRLAEAVGMANETRAALRDPYDLDGLRLDLDARVGVALYPQHGSDGEMLLRVADVAAGVARERGRGVQVYRAKDDRHSPELLRLSGELRRALDRDELELHYQPQGELPDGRVRHLEALVRWRHPVRGLLSPEVFVPLAEAGGLMRPLTAWVVRTALAQVADWRRSGLDLGVSVNVSAYDVLDQSFAAQVSQQLDAFEVPPERLTVEVTEGTVVADMDRAAATLSAVGALGVQLSLDDFGTGYSSLTHLRHLPVHEIKIDRGFVMRMDVDEGDARFVDAVIQLARALGLRVVAEGVESEQTWTRLSELGCNAAQGWFLAAPLSPERLPEWLAMHRPEPGLLLIRGVAG